MVQDSGLEVQGSRFRTYDWGG